MRRRHQREGFDDPHAGAVARVVAAAPICGCPQPDGRGVENGVLIDLSDEAPIRRRCRNESSGSRLEVRGKEKVILIIISARAWVRWALEMTGDTWLME